MNKTLLASYVSQLNATTGAIHALLATQGFLWGQIAPMLGTSTVIGHASSGKTKIASVVPIANGANKKKLAKRVSAVAAVG